MQFSKNATGHRVSVNKFRRIQTQAKPHTIVLGDLCLLHSGGGGSLLKSSTVQSRAD